MSTESVGRNEPCPCGSGQKFKRCCLGTGGIEEQRRKKLISTLLTVVVVLAIAVGALVSKEMGIIAGVVGLAATGVWLWLTAEPPTSGTGTDPGAINFGR